MESGTIHLNSLNDLKKLPQKRQKSAKRQLLLIQRKYPKASLVECLTPAFSLPGPFQPFGKVKYSSTLGTVLGYTYELSSSQVFLKVLADGAISRSSSDKKHTKTLQ